MPPNTLEFTSTELALPHMYNATTVQDIMVASLALGFTIGFGFLTTWEAIKQTRSARAPLQCVYIWMVWGEILANVTFAIAGYMVLCGIVAITLPVLLIIATAWVIEIQFLMQIIINRLAIVLSDSVKARKLKWYTAALVTFINISVYCVWIPARLEVNDTLVHVNAIWDRIEKGLVLLIDAGLNWYFIKVVKERLVEQGLKKYDALVRFNVRIIMISLAMDVLIIGCMSLKNDAVYLQIHPVAYTVKLNIEMSMAKLITKIAQHKSDLELVSSDFVRSSTNPQSASFPDPQGLNSITSNRGIHKHQDINVESASTLDEPLDYDSTENITATNGISRIGRMDIETGDQNTVD